MSTLIYKCTSKLSSCNIWSPSDTFTTDVHPKSVCTCFVCSLVGTFVQRPLLLMLDNYLCICLAELMHLHSWVIVEPPLLNCIAFPVFFFAVCTLGVIYTSASVYLLTCQDVMHGHSSHTGWRLHTLGKMLASSRGQWCMNHIGIDWITQQRRAKTNADINLINSVCNQISALKCPRCSHIIKTEKSTYSDHSTQSFKTFKWPNK